METLSISIVVPLYNKQNAITSTIQSVLDQSVKDYEIVIVDDGSTDNSLEIVHSFDDERIRVIHKENGGVSSARNTGIKAAKGDYVALLDADDVWDRDYLKEQLRMVADFPDCHMWGINYAETFGGEIVRDVPTGLPKGFRGVVEDYYRIKGRISDLFCSSSVIIKKEAFDKVGFFDERIRYAEDSDMWFRIIARFQVAFYDRYMVFYRFDAENRAQNQRRPLKYFLPFFVDKYQSFQDNTVFYTWVNRWSAQHIAYYYFNSPMDLDDASIAAKRLDYHVIPNKYKLLFGLPYFFGKALYCLIRFKNRMKGTIVALLPFFGWVL